MFPSKRNRGRISTTFVTDFAKKRSHENSRKKIASEIVSRNCINRWRWKIFMNEVSIFFAVVFNAFAIRVRLICDLIAQHLFAIWNTIINTNYWVLNGSTNSKSIDWHWFTTFTLFTLIFTQTKGLQCLPRLVLFTSADAHYSVKKLASFMGLGMDNVYLINTDSVGKMDASHLGG